MPLTIQGDLRSHRRHLETSTNIKFLLTLRITVLSICFIFSFMCCEFILSYFFLNPMSKLSDMLQKVNGMAGTLLCLIIGMWKRDDLKDCIYALADIDFRCKYNRLSSKYMRTTVIIWILMFPPGFLNCIYMTYTVFGILIRNGIWPYTVECVAFFSPCLVLTSISMMFVCFVYIISEYLETMNKVLKNLSNQWENRKIRSISAKSRSLNCLDSFSMYTIVTKNPCEIIHESMEIHHLICEAASTANKYFTYQLLTIISIAFLIIVFDAYYVLETLLGKSKRESKFKTVEFVTFFSCQMILYLIAIISIVEGSNRAIKKSEQTGGIVHGLLNKAKSPDVKEKLQQFSMQLMHLKINFTAAGLFNIDRTLYFTISGALTTYLIILLQFTSSAPNGSVPCSFGQNGNITAIGNATIAPNN
ncbi:putative gustatory receptor 28b isoform X4 [Eupeodes corollae]|uniref:putative gustatory receptor 28b isoform X4 n=1 Tax=Eupeodes corollae TaxID=290404 RepID=UPI002490121D|nr:putative gustatory receptor 28b isoform X4 [Eupeodes corollae]